MRTGVGRSLPVLLVLGLACSGGSSGGGSPAAEKVIMAGDAWALPGKPVAKLVVTAPAELAALTERHAYVEREDGAIRIGGDNPRQVSVLHEGGGEAQELVVLREGEYLADVAPGPDAGSLWILAIRWNADAQVLEPRLGLFAGETAKVEIASFPLEPGRFESVDATAPVDPSLRYAPPGDTIDVYRMASAGPQVAVVGRNAVGTVFADRYVYGDRRLDRVAREVLVPPYRGMLVGMSGGSYDVLGWLGNRYRVHASMSPGGTLHAGATVRGAELAGVDALFGSNWIDRLGLENVLAREVAMVFRVGPQGGAAPVDARYLGGIQDYLFSSLTSVSDDRCIGAGLYREPEGRSVPYLFEVGGSLRALPTSHGSTAFQTVAVDALGRLMVGGSWDWSQNPAGLSISGGSRFVSLLPAEGDAWPEQNLLQGGRRRSEVRSIVQPAAGVWCAGGMDDGPDTHAADNDAALLEADGFVQCGAWEAP